MNKPTYSAGDPIIPTLYGCRNLDGLDFLCFNGLLVLMLPAVTLSKSKTRRDKERTTVCCRQLNSLFGGTFIICLSLFISRTVVSTVLLTVSSWLWTCHHSTYACSSVKGYHWGGLVSNVFTFKWHRSQAPAEIMTLVHFEHGKTECGWWWWWRGSQQMSDFQDAAQPWEISLLNFFPN